MDVEIRPFQDCDETGVIALWDEVFASDPAWNKSSVMIRRKKAVQPQLFFVALQNGRIIGTVMAGYDGVRGWIHRLAVADSSRRAGIARRLMQAAEAALRKMDCPKINLQVRTGNVQVIDFYRKLGYAVEENIGMAKRLE